MKGATSSKFLPFYEKSYSRSRKDIPVGRVILERDSIEDGVELLLHEFNVTVACDRLRHGHGVRDVGVTPLFDQS